MFEKVNMHHPDKIADRIAGALVDMAYAEQENPKVAVEVLIGHDMCKIMTESSVNFAQDYKDKVQDAVFRIVGHPVQIELMSVEQDKHLAENQAREIRCGDNGIFKGVPISKEESTLADIAKIITDKYPYDGKYVLDSIQRVLIVCQSNAYTEELKELIEQYAIYPMLAINPLGFWTGGINADTGATNRKLGSDMGRAVTGGGLHGKDLSKADVSINIYLHLLAKELQEEVSSICAIGNQNIHIYNSKSESIKFLPYEDIVDKAREYINSLGGFEKFAEWGLIR